MTRIAITIAIAVSCVAFLLVGCDLSSSSSRKEQAQPVHSGGAVPTVATPKAKLKKGEPDPRTITPAADPSQPAVGPLPADIGLATTDVELGAHALMLAQEEHAQGILGGKTVSDRHFYIYQTWMPQMIERQQMLQQIVDQRATDHQAKVVEVGRIAKHEATMDQTDARLSAEVAAERRKTVPILTKQDVDVLE